MLSKYGKKSKIRKILGLWLFETRLYQYYTMVLIISPLHTNAIFDLMRLISLYRGCVQCTSTPFRLLANYRRFSIENFMQMSYAIQFRLEKSACSPNASHRCAEGLLLILGYNMAARHGITNGGHNLFHLSPVWSPPTWSCQPKQQEQSRVSISLLWTSQAWRSWTGPRKPGMRAEKIYRTVPTMSCARDLYPVIFTQVHTIIKNEINTRKVSP